MNKIIAAIRAVLPEASFDTDNLGQIVIYTNMSEDDNGEWVPFVEGTEESED